MHRQLTALLEGKKPRSHADELFVLGEHCTRTERRAEAAERELIRVKLLTHLETRIGETFHAIVVGVEDFGIFCRLVELPVEGLIHVTSLADDYYYLESGTHTLVGRSSGRRHRLGDRTEVRVAHVDLDRRQLDLVLADSPLSQLRRQRSASTGALPPHAAAAKAGSHRRATATGSSGGHSARGETTRRTGARPRRCAGPAAQSEQEKEAIANVEPNQSSDRGSGGASQILLSAFLTGSRNALGRLSPDPVPGHFSARSWLRFSSELAIIRLQIDEVRLHDTYQD